MCEDRDRSRYRSTMARGRPTTAEHLEVHARSHRCRVLCDPGFPWHPVTAQEMPAIWWRCAILRRMRSHHVAVVFAILLGTICPARIQSRSSQQNPTPQPAAGPDSQVQAGTPTGEVIKGEFDQSKLYPGTWREYWV